jgi:DNA-binding GntR family transcriptional regulator
MPASQAERAYRDIRAGIVDGIYRPHQRLVETDLASDMAISRTPVRQGLQRLELEGLVIASRVGWVVREHTADDIRGIYDVRIPLEGYAGRLAAEFATPDERDSLRAALEAITRILGSDNRTRFVELHDALHDAIVSAAHRPVLSEAIRQYREHPYNRRIAHSYSDDEMQVVAHSHQELVTAILDGDADRAESLVREHLTISRDATIHRLTGWG